jgi:parallel beta-helix repeat protein
LRTSPKYVRENPYGSKLDFSRGLGNATVGFSKRVFVTPSGQVVLTLLLLSAFVAPLVVQSHAASGSLTYYVSPRGSDSSGAGTQSNPYATVTHAVAEASSTHNASIVIVEPGTYHESVVLTTPVELVSASGQPSNTIINASGLPVGIAVVGRGAAGSVVEGLTVENSNNEGIFVQDSSGVVIENNVVTNNALNVFAGVGEDKGIQLTGTNESTVAGNTVVNNHYGGIGIADDGPIDPSWNATVAQGSGVPAGSPSPSENDIISGNTISNNRPNHCAIVISSYDQGEGVKNNVASRNIVVDNQNGVIIAADTPNTVAINNTIYSNDILNNGEGGVIVHSNAPGDLVTGNSIISNVIDSDGYLPTLEGIIIGGAGPVAVQSTTILGNTFMNEAVGIQIVNGKGTMVGGNTMEVSVKQAVNGTVNYIQTGSGGQTSGSTTVTNTVTATSVVTTTVQGATTVTGTASSSSSSSGGITLALALVTAVGTLVIGLVAGMIVRPIRESAGH